MIPSCTCPKRPCLCTERSLREQHHVQRLGAIDEVARGNLSGPTIAVCLVWLPALWQHEAVPEALSGVNDSKQLTAKRRSALVEVIQAHALAIGIGAASVREIDRLNILNATRLAMQRAIRNAGGVDFALLDGSPLRDLETPHAALAKGDTLCLGVAAASILAKETHSRLMQRLATRYPAYGWDRNKGYGTPEHLGAIERFGHTPHHRRSFGAQTSLL